MEKYFLVIPTWHGDIVNFFVPIIQIFQIYLFVLIGSCSHSHPHFVVSLCSFSTLIHCYIHFWWSRNSCKQLANDYVLLDSKMSIVWKTEVIISCPCSTC
jgi:hypothetical protein